MFSRGLTWLLNGTSGFWIKNEILEKERRSASIASHSHTPSETRREQTNTIVMSCHTRLLFVSANWARKNRERTEKSAPSPTMTNFLRIWANGGDEPSARNKMREKTRTNRVRGRHDDVKLPDRVHQEYLASFDSGEALQPGKQTGKGEAVQEGNTRTQTDARLRCHCLCKKSCPYRRQNQKWHSKSGSTGLGAV